MFNNSEVSKLTHFTSATTAFSRKVSIPLFCPKLVPRRRQANGLLLARCKFGTLEALVLEPRARHRRKGPDALSRGVIKSMLHHLPVPSYGAPNVEVFHQIEGHINWREGAWCVLDTQLERFQRALSHRSGFGIIEWWAFDLFFPETYIKKRDVVRVAPRRCQTYVSAVQLLPSLGPKLLRSDETHVFSLLSKSWVQRPYNDLSASHRCGEMWAQTHEIDNVQGGNLELWNDNLEAIDDVTVRVGSGLGPPKFGQGYSSGSWTTYVKQRWKNHFWKFHQKWLQNTKRPFKHIGKSMRGKGEISTFEAWVVEPQARHGRKGPGEPSRGSFDLKLLPLPVQS